VVTVKVADDHRVDMRAVVPSGTEVPHPEASRGRTDVAVASVDERGATAPVEDEAVVVAWDLARRQESVVNGLLDLLQLGILNEAIHGSHCEPVIDDGDLDISGPCSCKSQEPATQVLVLGLRAKDFV
jgi:hypothetical protein